MMDRACESRPLAAICEVIGFCLGGGLALLLAPGRGSTAASVNYGTAPKDAYSERFLARACPIVGSYGGKDRSLRGAAERLERALTAVGVDHDVKEYAEAGARLRQVPPVDQPPHPAAAPRARPVACGVRVAGRCPGGGVLDAGGRAGAVRSRLVARHPSRSRLTGKRPARAARLWR